MPLKGPAETATEPVGQRLGVAKGKFEVPDTIDAHNAEVARLFLRNSSDDCAKVGRAALDNPDLPIEFVRDTLLAIEEESEPFELGDSSRQPSADKSIDQF